MKRGVLLSLLGLSGLAVGFEFMETDGRGGHGFAGFMLVFSLGAAALLAVFAKLILTHALSRKPDYWEQRL